MRLNKNAIAKEIEELAVEEKPDAPEAPKLQPIVCDWSRVPGRWLGPDCDIRNRKSINLAAQIGLAEAEKAAGRTLTPQERMTVLRKFQ